MVLWNVLMECGDGLLSPSPLLFPATETPTLLRVFDKLDCRLDIPVGW